MGRWLQRLKNPKGGCSELTELPKPKAESLSVGNVSFVSSLHEPFQSLETVLLRTPFTLEMVEEGLRRWQQPFDRQDILDVQAGHLSAQQVIDYLALWKEQNHARYLELKQMKPIQAIRCTK